METAQDSPRGSSPLRRCWVRTRAGCYHQAKARARDWLTEPLINQASRCRLCQQECPLAQVWHRQINYPNGELTNVRKLCVSTVKLLMGDANDPERTFAALSKEARIR